MPFLQHFANILISYEDLLNFTQSTARVAKGQSTMLIGQLLRP